MDFTKEGEQEYPVPMSGWNPMYRSFKMLSSVQGKSSVECDTFADSQSVMMPSSMSSMSMEHTDNLDAQQESFLGSQRQHCSASGNQNSKAKVAVQSNSLVTREGKGWNNYFSSLILLILAMLSVVLSGTVMMLCFLMMSGVVTFTRHPAFMADITPTTSSCSQLCSVEVPNFELMTQHLMSIEKDMDRAQIQASKSTTEVVQRLDKLMLKTIKMSNAIQKITSMAEMASTPEVSGLRIPVQIDIDTSSGCDQTVDAQIVTYEITSYDGEPYTNETHIIIDFTCAAENSGMPCTEEFGVSLFYLENHKEAAEPSDAFNYLSQMNWICTCYKLGNCTQLPATCRRTITKCPYK